MIRLDLRYRFARWGERLTLGIIWALPRKWISWAIYRAMAHATQGPWSGEIVDFDIPVSRLLDRWERTTRYTDQQRRLIEAANAAQANRAHGPLPLKELDSPSLDRDRWERLSRYTDRQRRLIETVKSDPRGLIASQQGESRDA